MPNVMLSLSIDCNRPMSTIREYRLACLREQDMKRGHPTLYPTCTNKRRCARCIYKYKPRCFFFCRVGEELRHKYCRGDEEMSSRCAKSAWIHEPGVHLQIQRFDVRVSADLPARCRKRGVVKKHWGIVMTHCCLFSKSGRYSTSPTSLLFIDASVSCDSRVVQKGQRKTNKWTTTTCP